MRERALLLRYLGTGLLALGALEWLLGRTISRMAAAPTLEGFPRTIIEALGRTGIFFASPAFLVAVALVVSSVFNSFPGVKTQDRRSQQAIALYLALIAVLSLTHIFFGNLNWYNVSFHILALVAHWSLTLFFLLRRKENDAAKIALLLVALAYTGQYLFFFLERLAVRPALFGLTNLSAVELGELAAVLAPFPFFAATALPNSGWRNARRWILPLLLATLFSAGNIVDIVANQGFSGVFTIWSVGMRLFLPWPLYALALALFSYSVLTCFSRTISKSDYANRNTGLGLLLLLFAGYRLQIPYQHLLALLAMMLLTGFVTLWPAIVEPTRDERASERELRIGEAHT